jgi:hypothetical protein
LTGTNNVATQFVSFNDLSRAHTLIAEIAFGILLAVIDIGGKNAHV